MLSSPTPGIVLTPSINLFIERIAPFINQSIAPETLANTPFTAIAKP